MPYLLEKKEKSATTRQYKSFKTVLGFNDTSTLVGHFVSSPREKGEKRLKR